MKFKKKPHSILFVCTANICRSPMAAGLFLSMMEKANLRPMWRIESAGVWARDGMKVPNDEQQVMENLGIDLSGHLSREITEHIICDFALILTMEPGQKEALQIEFPNIAKHVYLLSEMVGETKTISDPYLGTKMDYLRIAEEISDILIKGRQRIFDLAEN